MSTAAFGVPDRELYIRTWTNAGMTLKTFKRTWGQHTYWTVEVWPALWFKETPALVEMLNITAGTQAEAEQRAAAYFTH